MTGAGRVIVVGGGLFGSAAARHLAESGVRTTVVTSPETGPGDENRWRHRPRASHYDQGRIVHRGGSDPFKTKARSRSMDRFPGVADRSGVDFFTARPLVTLTPDPGKAVLVSRANDADVDIWSPDEVTDRYGIAAPAGFAGGAVVESSRTAGFVNPRLLVHAQLKLAAAAGATIINCPAQRVSVKGGAGATVQVDTIDGQRVDGDQLLLATGPYGAALLGLDLPIQRRLRTVALIEIGGDAGPAAEGLPSLSASGFIHPDGNDPDLEETYWVPPVPYPDGGTYLKIGGNSLPMMTADDDTVEADISRWFHDGGSSDEANALFALARDLLPGRTLRLAGYKPCVVSYTADEQPIVKRLDNRIVVALAGNGTGASISDEIGRRAADLVSSPSEL